MTSPILHEEPAMPVRMTRVVLTHGVASGDGHEAASHKVVAARLGVLLDLPYAGACKDGQPYGCYIVPRAPLSGRGIVARLGIGGEQDLFGGWVPRDWMATKAIMHPLVSPGAAAPPDWPHLLAQGARPLTLRGFTAFSARDALAAAHLLLRAGPVRLKPANADGGRGQIVVRNEAEIDAAIASLSAGGRLADIVVLEENLEEVGTFSVGQVRLPGHLASYCGTQSLTRNNDGATAYGGSSLMVVRGGFDRLLALPPPREMEEPITLAMAFDALADRHLPGLIASRRNYDVASGIAADGSRRVGVLEQSWRMGGATGAELAAVEVLAREAPVAAVHARTVEAYGGAPAIPAGATLYYRGIDPALGPLTKYACVERRIEGGGGSGFV